VSSDGHLFNKPSTKGLPSKGPKGKHEIEIEKKIMTTDLETLTVKEVAAILKVGVKNVYDLIARNRIPGVVRYGRAIRFNGSVFREWLNDCSEVTDNACTVMRERESV
jgi:excisionase family DNA binding protein